MLNLPQILKNFPIAFGSPVQKSQFFFSLANKRDHLGVTKVYEVLLNSIVNNTLQDLEDALEYNFLKKLSNSLADLHSHGYKLKLRGDIEQSTVYYKKATIYSGSILPFRNLILPFDSYRYTGRRWGKYLSNHLATVHKPKDLNIVAAKFDNFDFVAANKDEKHDYSNAVHSILHTYNSVHTFVQDSEYIIHSPFKLLAVDQNGTVVSGNDNDEPEMHCMILENFKIKCGFNLNLIQQIKAYRYFKRAMGDFMGQKILTDFDEFLRGNLPIPEDLLIKL